MDCPECGEPLARYALRDREAHVCEACGYLGVAVDHASDPKKVESWEEALSRFRERAGAE